MITEMTAVLSQKYSTRVRAQLASQTWQGKTTGNGFLRPV